MAKNKVTTIRIGAGAADKGPEDEVEDVTAGTESEEESTISVASEEGQDDVVEEITGEDDEPEAGDLVDQDERITEPETEQDEEAEVGDAVKEAVTSVVTEPKIGSQDSEQDFSVHFASHNAVGHRIAMMNDRGNITVIDDDTALILYENPSFYVELYDSDRQAHIPTRMFTWVDDNKLSLGEPVGQPYDLNKDK